MISSHIVSYIRNRAYVLEDNFHTTGCDTAAGRLTYGQDKALMCGLNFCIAILAQRSTFEIVSVILEVPKSEFKQVFYYLKVGV